MSELERQIYDDTLNLINTATDKISMILESFFNDLNRQKDLIPGGEKNVKLMLNHVKRGGKLLNIAVPNEDLDLMKKCLMSENIPFTVINLGSNDKQNIVFRDSDNLKVEKAKEKFQLEKGIGLSEMEPSEFLEVNRDQKVITFELNRVETEIFKYHANELKIPYSIAKGDDDKCKVMYVPNDKNNIEIALKRMAYDMSGERADEIITQVENKIKTRDMVENAMISVSEPFYLVDSKNPNRFIYITPEDFSTHSIIQTTTRDRRGNEKEELVDKNSSLVKRTDGLFIEKFQKEVSLLANPVLLRPNEFPLVKGLDLMGEAVILPEDLFKEERAKLIKELGSKQTIYPKDYIINPTLPKEKFVIYRNLEKNKIFQIVKYTEHLPETERPFIKDGCLCFKEKNLNEIGPYVEKVLYGDLTPLEKIADKLYYEGRGDINFHDLTEPKYIINGEKATDFIEVTEEKAILYKNGLVKEEIDRNDPDFEEKFVVIYDDFNNSVVLNSKEFNLSPEEKIAVMNFRVPEIQNRAIEESLNNVNVRERDFFEKQVLGVNDYHIPDVINNPKIQKATKIVKDVVHKEIKVERGIVEKFLTHNLSQKEIQRPTKEVSSKVDRSSIER